MLSDAEVAWLKMKALVEVGAPAYYAALQEKQRLAEERQKLLDDLRREAAASRLLAK